MLSLLLICAFTVQHVCAMELNFKDANQAIKFSEKHPKPVLCLVESGSNCDEKKDVRKLFKELAEKCDKLLHCATFKKSGNQPRIALIVFFHGKQIFEKYTRDKYLQWLRNPDVLKKQIQELQGESTQNKQIFIALPVQSQTQQAAESEKMPWVDPELIKYFEHASDLDYTGGLDDPL